jgi:hypothetical protein
VRHLTALAAALLLGACATSHSIAPVSSFPKPALQPLALNAGLYADSEFSGYVHQEEVPPRATWRVTLGAPSVVLFQTILGAQFRELKMIGGDPDASKKWPVDIAFRPKIEEFQFATAQAAGAEFIEAWIKYSVSVMAPDGREMANWPIAAYGRHRAKVIGGTEQGVDLAVKEAMRDAGAALALKLRTVRKLSAPAPAAGPEPAPAPAVAPAGTVSPTPEKKP